MDALFLDILNISITASYIIIAVILLRFIFKKFPRKFFCFLWAIAGIRLVLPLDFESVFSLIPSAKTIPNDFTMSQSPAISSGIPMVNSIVNPVISETLTPEAGNSVNPLQIVSFIASIVWIIGIAVILLYGLISYIRVKKTVKGAVLLCDNLWQSENVVSPFILGIFRPAVYLPFGMDEQTQSYVIAHEKAHLKRRDHWIKPLGFVILAFHWFNPLVWIAYVLLCKDIEVACDEKVVSQMDNESRKEYATALLDCAVNRRKIAACPLAFGEVGIKERIKGVMNYRKPAFWIIIFAVIACVAVSVCFLTNPVKENNSYYDLGYRLFVEVEDFKGTTQLPKETFYDSYDITTGTKGKLINGVKFEITVPDLQTGCLTLKFNKSVGWNGKEIKTITVNLDESETVVIDGMDMATFSFERTQSLDDAISEAILEYNEDKYLKGTFACEAHQALHTQDFEDYDGTTRTRYVDVYLMVEYCEFVCFGGEPENVSGGRSPVKMSFDYDFETGRYVLTEYWEADDGRTFGDSVKENFTPEAADRVLNKIDLADLQSECVKQAKLHYGTANENAFVYCDIPTVNVETTFFYDKPKFEYTVYNDGKKDITLGLTNRMYKYENGIWKELENDQIPVWHLPFDVTEIRVKPGESNTMTCLFEWFKMEGEGHYRFETTLKSHTESPAVEGTIIIDFSIGSNRVNPDISEAEQTTVAFIEEETTVRTKTDGSVTYTLESSNEYIKPYINLKNGRFVFFTSVYSSYRCEGEYELTKDKLILNSDDGRYTFVFNVEGDNMVFDAMNSSEPEKFKPSAKAEPVPVIQDGDIFTKG